MAALQAVLSDVDDTLINSRKTQGWAWAKWAAGHRLDPMPFLTTHGLRIEEKLERFAPDLDPVAEAASLVALAARCPFKASALPGAQELFASTETLALVTSGLRAVVLPQLEAAGLAPLPSVIVAAEDVTSGKPDPQPYLIAASMLGVEPADCVVLEDAPDGVRAGVAAGMKVVGITTTTSPLALRSAGASRVLTDVARFLLERERGTLGL
jgi:sugar-phosphatase